MSNYVVGAQSSRSNRATNTGRRSSTVGFVIYRTTYDSDADWAEFIKRLQFHMSDTFEWVGGQDILANFSLTVFDDREQFDGASTQAVRQHFLQWSATASRDEQQPPTREQGNAPNRISVGRSPRYRYALAVDAESLRSVVHDAPAPPEMDVSTTGWVQLIDKSWYLGRSLGRNTEDYPAIEGVTERDVGWMRVTYRDVMSQCYVRSESMNFWSMNYRRPPQVVQPL